jgi:hypothetical protein
LIASALSSIDYGAPKNIIIASPMNLSIVPPHFAAIFVIYVRYSFMSDESSSASREFVVSVKLLMSEKNTVIFRRSVREPAVLAPEMRLFTS